MQGFILDHRQELISDIWKMPPLYHRLWQWLKYIANHADNTIPMRDGTKMLIKRGQHLTSIRDIANDIGWYEGRKKKVPNPKTIDAILKFLILNNMISIDRGKGNREYTLITLINYDKYQPVKDQGNGKVTADGEGRDQSMDINNNEYNYKELISIIFEHWMSKKLVKHKSLNPHIRAQILYKLSDHTKDELIQAIDAYDSILNNPEYKLNTRWGMEDFLSKDHFKKFLPDRDPYTFYPRVINDLVPPKQSKFEKDKENLRRMHEEAAARERDRDSGALRIDKT
ncbi:hypothetical protein [Paenibacillus sp. NRS-1760]|uniref:hypothetical protein n=1 Tax=Paenibacillus sp. NRS-1760 TaxID=3233902 RepID=UPI003D29D818